MAIILLISGAVSLVTCAAFFAYELVTFRHSLMANYTIRSQIIAANSTAALAFLNEVDAAEVLSALRADPHVEAAALYDQGGKLFARYPAHRPDGTFPVSPGAEGFRFEQSRLVAVQPVIQGERRLGTLYLQSDLAEMTERFRLYASIVVLIMAGSFALAYVLSRTLEKQITRPILSLVETARAISERHDYSVRAVKMSEDELGLLTDALNQMLVQIHEQNQALRESEGRLRAVLNAALSAVVVIDTAGRVIDWNARAEKMFDWPRKEALGRELSTLIIPPHYREAHRRGMQHFLSTGEGPVLNSTLEMSALRRDGGEFPVELSISPLKSGDVVTFCGFITDITERKRAAEEILQLNLTLERRVTERTTQLEVANKELESFSYSVSHDLRAPLRHIDGFAGLLVKLDGRRVSERGLSYLTQITDSAKQMGMLIDDLLVFSRMARSEMNITEVDLWQLVDETIQRMSTETQNRSIQWDKKALPVVPGDRPMLRQVFVNLIANAIKYTRPRNPAIIEIGSGQDSPDEAVIYVRDNGVGFEMEYAHKLFGVFQRLHRAEDFEGTGIGLANVRRIITRHGGRTWAEGKPDAGATFYFTLPKKGEPKS